MTDRNSTEYAGWGRALRANGVLARPNTQSEINANAPAIGNRRSYGDAALITGGTAQDLTQLDRIIAFDRTTGLLTVEAGISLGELARVLAPQGWLPAVLPGTGFATVGGAIGMDVHGKNHHHVGSFCQHVTSITLIQGEKTKTITPKSGSIWKATCGGLGQTGIIVQATLQLSQARGDMMLVSEQRATDWDHHIALLDGSDAPYTVGWIDAMATGTSLGRGIVEEGEICRGLKPTARGSKKIPFDAPHLALSSPIVRAFNALYYRRVPKSGRTVVRPINDFFFPLDKIHDWNKLYGRRGFHQFQCVVPLNQSSVLREMMEKVASSGLASPLAVLKRMGAGLNGESAGYMSFPMEGYTLAIDFPNRPAARDLIAKLESLALKANGRIYLAKDALSTGTAIKSMYTDHPKWAAATAKADPHKHLQTDMTRRLDLRT
ncbi:FAD-binding oxidoreductase [Octadecabacter sp. CECT 8868]|uniref:FAD-binding oxidoreductase n=1 Tax=Octadecabacter algicola TaxID=2909342 RepID=UPI001F3039BE|nr:FAD-binding oxidoreductase [Octadecabacter algicola]MCF2906359.1 FAD-binding oxidoreductase [Octadecabacter algicola]